MEESERGIVEAKRKERVEGLTTDVEESRKAETRREVTKAPSKGTRLEDAE